MGRVYQSRDGEFFDLSIDQLKDVELPAIAAELSAIKKEQKTNKTEENEKRRKELNNKRIRIYARMRKLDYKASEFRGGKKGTPKVEPIVSPETQAKLDEIAKQKEAEDAKTKQEITADHALEPEKRTSQIEKQEEQPIVQQVQETNTLIVSSKHSSSEANKRIILSLKQ